VFIDLANARSSELLNLPARPGDAILVPASGEVMVQGWVANPGAFNITPGMTVLGAITAAGGQMFSSSAELLRKNAAGAEVDIPLDLSKIRHQETTDPAVQSGDVIIINRSVIGAAPYLVYSIFNHFSTGIYPAAAAF